MKKIFYSLLLVAVTAMSCKKESNSNGTVSCSLPSTTVPAEMTGNWASGFNSGTNIVDAYNGQYLGNNWQSGKYFHFSADGKYAEFYYLANAGITSSTATKAIGTVTFDEAEGSFIFHCCSAHYRGWQNAVKTVDRDATAQEKEELLTRKYYYSFEESGDNVWMQIRFEPGGNPTSFESVQ